MKKILKFFIKPVYSLLSTSAFRYSAEFLLVRNLLAYAPAEEMLLFAMDCARVGKLEGDYLEFGVAQGQSFVSAYHFAQYSGYHSMKFYAFDSFEGLPEIKGVDKDGYAPFTEGEFAYSVSYFKSYISKRKVNLDKVHIVKGFYDKTLNIQTKATLPTKKAAVIMIDCDLYESTVPILNFITSYIQPGTIIIFDDWFCFRGDPQKGEEKAFNQWLEKNQTIKTREFRRYGANGISFIVYAV